MKSVILLYLIVFSGLTFCQDKVDYSEEWRKGNPDASGFDLSKTESTTAKITAFNLSKFWLNKSMASDGILGETYQRIQFYITETLKCNDSIYQVKGKNRIKGLISEFEGTIKVTTVYNKSFMDCDNGASDSECKTVVVIGECTFEEPSDQKASGVFTGTMQTHLDYIPEQNTLSFNAGDTISDKYYQNNTFVGVWRSRRTGLIKKCVFGDWALPQEFLEDFRKYYGGVTEKNRSNGWETFGVYEDEGVYLVDNLDKWWL